MPLEILRVSASSSPAPGIRLQPTVTKLVDTSTCIGCKACEVACQEWNDLPPETTVQMGTYQTLPDMTENFWNLIKLPRARRRRGRAALADAEGPVHALHRARLPGGLSGPGAIVQYTNGIVDFQQDQCIGCGYCMTGCPFNVPKFSQKTRRVYKCTLCVDRTSVGLQPACVKACPTSCLQFGTKEQMLEVADKRVDQLKANGFAQAAVYDPPGVGGTGVVTVLAYRRSAGTVRPAAQSHHSARGPAVEGSAQDARQSGDVRRPRRRGRATSSASAANRSRRKRVNREHPENPAHLVNP